MPNPSVQATCDGMVPRAPELKRCRGRFAPATTGRGIQSTACAALRAAQAVDQTETWAKAVKRIRI